MSTHSGAGAAHGVDDVFIQISDDEVTIECDTHPSFRQSRALSDGHRVPGTWFVAVIAAHLEQHTMGMVEEPAAEPAASSAMGSSLDPFAREIAAACLWAMDLNEGDPDEDWPLQRQLAVALVLGNHLYLSAMGDGPGYTPQDALFLLHSGMASPPADVGVWIEAIRNEIRRPGKLRKPSGPWKPFDPSRDQA